MSGQQDKSKDKTTKEHPLDTLESTGLFQPTPPSASSPQPSSFFDKFKHPHTFMDSAFRLYNSSGAGSGSSYSKKSQIIRKHRGNYRKYTVAEKEEAVKQILQGVDAKEISEKYGIPRRNLLRWKKNGCERKEGGGRPTDGEMQLTLYTKIDQKILLTEKDIRNQAKNLSKMTQFKASKGWYCKFSRRYNQWKKQERLRAIRQCGDVEEQKEVFLLPEVSGGSESDSDQSDSDDCSPSEVKHQQ